MEEKVYHKGFKAFDKGLVCKGKQYAEHTVFEEAGTKGMHYCENPFDVLDYYPLVDDNGNFSEFAEVESLAEPKADKTKQKFCTSKLRVKAKLSFGDFIKACVEFTKEKTNFPALKNVTNDNGETEAQIGSFGFSSQIGSSGDYAQIGSSGDYARISSSGDYARIGSFGFSSQIGSSGDYAQIGSSGDCAKIGSSGYSSQIGSSGDYARIGSSGDYARIGSSGHSSQIGSSGDYARIGSSGDYARIGSSGHSSQIGSSGDYAQISSSGEYSVICCAGHSSKAKAKKGSWITLAEWEYSFEKERCIPICVKTEFVDGERIKEDTFYRLENGEFVEQKGE